MRPVRDKGRKLVRMASPLPRAEWHPDHLAEWQDWLEQEVAPLPRRSPQGALLPPASASAAEPTQPLPLGAWADCLRHTETCRRIDLHGQQVQQAYLNLREFLQRQQAAGVREVWVITGKGPDGRGALRGEVPKWLKLWSDLVRQVSVASHREGGAGAFKLVLVRPLPKGGRHG